MNVDVADYASKDQLSSAAGSVGRSLSTDLAEGPLRFVVKLCQAGLISEAFANTGIPIAIVAGLSRGKDYLNDILSGMAPNTRKAFQEDLVTYFGWCQDKGYRVIGILPEDLRNFVVWLSEPQIVYRRRWGKPFKRRGLRHRSISRMLSSVGTLHKIFDYPSPTLSSRITAKLKAVRQAERAQNDPTRGQAIPFSHDMFRDVLQKMDPLVEISLAGERKMVPNLTGMRDMVILALGLFTGLRYSEAASISLEGLREEKNGYSFSVEAKTGTRTGYLIETNNRLCPVRIIKGWIDLSGITRGPLITPVTRNEVPLVGRSIGERTYNRRIQACVKSLDLNPKGYSGHSLRRGCANWLFASGADAKDVQNFFEWKDPRMPIHYKKAFDQRSLAEKAASG